MTKSLTQHNSAQHWLKCQSKYVFVWNVPKAMLLFTFHSPISRLNTFIVEELPLSLWPCPKKGTYCQVDSRNGWLFFFLPLRTMHRRNPAVNKAGKVSHCWVIADVPSSHWETFNSQLCLAFLRCNRYCNKWAFHRKEAMWICNASLSLPDLPTCAQF